MSRICQFCQKKAHKGHSRCFSMKSHKRWFKPNIFYKKIKLEENFEVKVKICSSCYKKYAGQGVI